MWRARPGETLLDALQPFLTLSPCLTGQKVRCKHTESLFCSWDLLWGRCAKKRVIKIKMFYPYEKKWVPPTWSVCLLLAYETVCRVKLTVGLESASRRKTVDLLAAGDDSVNVNYQTFMSRGGSYGSSVGGDNAAEPVTQSSLCFDIRKRDTRTG